MIEADNWAEMPSTYFSMNAEKDPAHRRTAQGLQLDQTHSSIEN